MDILAVYTTNWLRNGLKTIKYRPTSEMARPKVLIICVMNYNGVVLACTRVSSYTISYHVHVYKITR